MKYSWQILTLLMAVALVAMAIKITTLKRSAASTNTTIDKGEVVYNAILTRSSVRSYTSKKVDTETIDKLLKAGMAAPTAGNRQPWELVVIDQREVLDKIADIIPGAHMAAKAQLAIAVLGSPTKSLLPDYWVQDCSAVTENILLAAHGFGLGAVWCGAYPNNDADRVGRISELLALPKDNYALSIIVVGHPDKEPKVKDKWDAAKVHYNKY